MGSSFALFLFWMNCCRFGLWRTLIMIHHLTTSSLPHLLNSGPLTALQHAGGIHSWVLCTATGEFIVVLPSLLVISTLVIVILYSLLFWCYLSSLSHAMFSSDYMTRYLGELFSYFLEHIFFCCLSTKHVLVIWICYYEKSFISIFNCSKIFNDPASLRLVTHAKA